MPIAIAHERKIGRGAVAANRKISGDAAQKNDSEPYGLAVVYTE
jgi:hypothetical protein